MKLLSKTEYAKHRGVSAAAVTKAVQSGRISLIDGKIDPEVADIQWKKNTDPIKAAASNGGKLREIEHTIQTSAGMQLNQDTLDLMHWKSRRERSEALRSEQAQALEAGNLVYKDDVQRGAKTAARMLRDQFLSIPSRLAAELANIDDAVQIEQRIRHEIRSALTSMDKLLNQNN